MNPLGVLIYRLQTHTSVDCVDIHFENGINVYGWHRYDDFNPGDFQVITPGHYIHVCPIASLKAFHEQQ